MGAVLLFAGKNSTLAVSLASIHPVLLALLLHFDDFWTWRIRALQSKLFTKRLALGLTLPGFLGKLLCSSGIFSGFVSGNGTGASVPFIVQRCPKIASFLTHLLLLGLDYSLKL